MVSKVHFSSDVTLWETPQWLYNVLDAEFGIDIDVCATPENAKARHYWTEQQDALSQEWLPFQVYFMNPPYGNPEQPCKTGCQKKTCHKRGHHQAHYLPGIGDWVRKAFLSANNGATCVTLLPARTDTKWWWSYCSYAEIRFLRGRLKFCLNGQELYPAPFPSAVVVFHPYQRLRTVRWWIPTRTKAGQT